MINVLHRVHRSIVVKRYLSEQVPDGELAILPLGSSFRRASTVSVTVISIRNRAGEEIDLRELATGPHVQIIDAPASAGASSKAVLKLRHGSRLYLNRGGPWRIRFLANDSSGTVRLLSGAFRLDVDLRKADPAAVEIIVPQDSRSSTRASVSHARLTALQAARMSYVERVDQLVAGAFANIDDSFDGVLAISTPRWRGVTASTKRLFQRYLPFPLDSSDHPDDVEEWQTEVFADAIARRPIRTIVLSGGDRILKDLLLAVSQRRPDIRFMLLWHSSFLQMGEDHDWRLLNIWLDAARSGLLARIGVVKKDLDVLLRKMGLPAVHVLNRVDFDPDRISATQVNNKVGIWLSGSSEYRKQPYNTICAFARLPEVTLVGAGLDHTAVSMVRRLRIRHERLSLEPLPQDLLYSEIKKTALSAYVTISECMPMLPLESIALGVPCLIGPSCELFRDDPILRELYVVREPGSPTHIGKKIAAALEAKDEVFAHLVRYMVQFNERSRASVESFLD